MFVELGCRIKPVGVESLLVKLGDGCPLYEVGQVIKSVKLVCVGLGQSCLSKWCLSVCFSVGERVRPFRSEMSIVRSEMVMPWYCRGMLVVQSTARCREMIKRGCCCKSVVNGESVER